MTQDTTGQSRPPGEELSTPDGPSRVDGAGAAGQPPHSVSQEQLAYAALLRIGGIAAIIVLAVTLAIYLSQFVAPMTPIATVVDHWHLPPHEYNARTGGQTGWNWVHRLGYGDYLSFAGIAILVSISVVCYIRILPILIRKRDWLYVAIAVIEVLVLALAASGILHAGH